MSGGRCMHMKWNWRKGTQNDWLQWKSISCCRGRWAQIESKCSNDIHASIVADAASNFPLFKAIVKKVSTLGGCLLSWVKILPLLMTKQQPIFSIHKVILCYRCLASFMTASMDKVIDDVGNSDCCPKPSCIHCLQVPSWSMEMQPFHSFVKHWNATSGSSLQCLGGSQKFY